MRFRKGLPIQVLIGVAVLGLVASMLLPVYQDYVLSRDEGFRAINTKNAAPAPDPSCADDSAAWISPPNHGGQPMPCPAQKPASVAR